MKLKITIFFILLSLLTIVILLVNKRDSSDFQEIIYDNSRNYTYVPLANIGLSIGIVNDEHDQLIENMNFELEGTENFQGTIALVNQNEEEKDYLIVPLINYKQKKIRLGEDYQDKIKDAIEKKIDGKEIKKSKSKKNVSVSNLMDALEKSLKGKK